MKSNVFLLKWLFLAGIICALVLCNSCKAKTKGYEPAYSADASPKKILLFGVPTQSYYDIYDLLVNYLNERLQGAQLQTVAASNFVGYMDKLDDQYFDFTIVNGGTAIQCARK